MKKLPDPSSVRGVNYATSPLLASKTPSWRSRFIVAAVGLGFAGLLGRAAYIQIVGPEFFQREGEKRYAHTLEVPGTRGRVLDRGGQLLATSVPVPSVWAIPKDFQASLGQRAKLAVLLGMDGAELESRLTSGSASFAWLRRQIDTDTWTQIQALGIKGLYQSREYRRRYPEGESAAHVVGFTNLEDQGQEGIELAFQKQLQGKNGDRKSTRLNSSHQ